MPESLERFDDASPKPEAPQRALEDIEAEHANAMAEADSQTREAVSFDERCAAIGDCLMDLYMGDPETAADLEPYVDEGRFPIRPRRFSPTMKRANASESPITTSHRNPPAS